jgi:hypothetical protein
VANTLAYYDTATITAVKSFIVQAPGGREEAEEKQPGACLIKLITAVIYSFRNKIVFVLKH